MLNQTVKFNKEIEELFNQISISDVDRKITKNLKRRISDLLYSLKKEGNLLYIKEISESDFNTQKDKLPIGTIVKVNNICYEKRKTYKFIPNEYVLKHHSYNILCKYKYWLNTDWPFHITTRGAIPLFSIRGLILYLFYSRAGGYWQQQLPNVYLYPVKSSHPVIPKFITKFLLKDNSRYIENIEWSVAQKETKIYKMINALTNFIDENK